ncbi:MAG: hypothetical protein ACREN3_06740, partial [Gemmatimonadaceae bacterium]
ADALVRAAVGLHDSTWVTESQVADAVERIYSAGRFDQVSYRVQPRPGGDDLLFDLTEGDRDVVGLGVRYSTPRGAALLVGATVNDWLTPGSKVALSARLGDELQFDGRYLLGAGPEARFLQTYSATFTRTSLPHVRPPGVESAPVIDVQQASAQIARVLGHAGYIGVDLTHARSNDGVRGGDSVFALLRQSYTTVGGILSLDTYDRVFAPTTGAAALMVWTQDLGRGRSFARRFADLQGALPLGGHVSLLGQVDAGYASGPGLPLHDRFFLGGSLPSAVWPSQFVPFLGIDPQSAVGTVVHMAQAGVQAEVRDNVFVSLRGNVGNVFDTWPAPVGWRSYLRGGGLTIGTMLAPGPLSITFGSRSLHQRPVIEINFGATF